MARTTRPLSAPSNLKALPHKCVGTLANGGIALHHLRERSTFHALDDCLGIYGWLSGAARCWTPLTARARTACCWGTCSITVHATICRKGTRSQGSTGASTPRRERLMCVRGNCDTEVDQMVLHFPIMADYAVFPAGRHLLYATHGHHFGEQLPCSPCAPGIYCCAATPMYPSAPLTRNTRT